MIRLNTFFDAMKRPLTLFRFIPFLLLAGGGVVYGATDFSPWGKDRDLVLSFCVNGKPLKEKDVLPQKGASPAQRFSCSLIRSFQVYISPIDGPRSSFYPTSSQYALEAIQRYGVIQGILLGCDRLLRENGEPWVYPTICRYGVIRKEDRVR